MKIKETDILWKGYKRYYKNYYLLRNYGMSEKEVFGKFLMPRTLCFYFWRSIFGLLLLLLDKKYIRCVVAFTIFFTSGCIWFSQVPLDKDKIYFSLIINVFTTIWVVFECGEYAVIMLIPIFHCLGYLIYYFGVSAFFVGESFSNVFGALFRKTKVVKEKLSPVGEVYQTSKLYFRSMKDSVCPLVELPDSYLVKNENS